MRPFRNSLGLVFGSSARLLYVSKVVAILSLANSAWGFEDTKVLPQGVRNITLRSVNANINSASTSDSSLRPLGTPLEKEVSFGQLAASKTGIEKSQVQAFLRVNRFDESEAIGQFQADIQGSVRALAPVFAYGITSKWTMAVAVPVYSAKSSVALGFNSTKRGQDFLNLLADPKNNNVKTARDAGQQMNSLISRLQNKLSANGFENLEDWSATGLGDVQLVSRYRFWENQNLSALWAQNIVFPTGYVEDPDILNDISFGTGSFGIGTTLSLEQTLQGSPFFINEYANYTAYLDSSRETRLKTREEIIEVDKKTVSVDPGDKIEFGASIQADTQIGLIGGLGGIYQRKYGDRYSGAGESNEVLEENTDQDARILEAQFGYSSINAFKRKETPIPYSLLSSYRRMVWSRNQPVAHQLQFDVKLFF